jgi:phospholipase C
VIQPDRLTTGPARWKCTLSVRKRHQDSRLGNHGFEVMRHATAALVLGVLAIASGRAFAQPQAAKTPIEHVIVLFQENVSFDHYFGTYPTAANLAGEHGFQADAETHSANGLTPALLQHNPNKSNPRRLSPRQAMTCDMDHQYMSEQQAYNGGLVNRFIEYASSSDKTYDPGVVMDYFDGNTVTAGECGRSCVDPPELDHPVHRGQLGSRPHRRPVA